MYIPFAYVVFNYKRAVQVATARNVSRLNPGHSAVEITVSGIRSGAAAFQGNVRLATLFPRFHSPFKLASVHLTHLTSNTENQMKQL